MVIRSKLRVYQQVNYLNYITARQVPSAEVRKGVDGLRAMARVVFNNQPLSRAIHIEQRDRLRRKLPEGRPVRAHGVQGAGVIGEDCLLERIMAMEATAAAPMPRSAEFIITWWLKICFE